VNTVMNLRITSYVGKFLRSCTTGGLTRRAQLVYNFPEPSASSAILNVYAR
jgi:hypothetical protein